MSEFRRDPLQNSWVIIRNTRKRDVQEFVITRQQMDMLSCPFCPGQEDRTPPEVYAQRPKNLPANHSGWQVRVVPNKFPILRIEGALIEHQNGLHRFMPGIGAHEVIIETRDHHRSLSEMSVGEIADVLKAYRARLLDLRGDKRFRYLHIFKNHGIEAGAPISHSHSQLMAVPITPPLTRIMLQSSKAYFHEHKQCLCCDMIAQELADGQRVVSASDEFVALAPFASRVPFETRLFPRKHGHDFALQSDSELNFCAQALQLLLRKLRILLDDPPYNFILHTAPPSHPQTEKPHYWSTLNNDFHWHFEVLPRLSQGTGFEWNSGFYINAMLPEDAAMHLRKTDLDLIY